MQRKINHDDFERFLQQNADQVRMYPSADVWKNISKDLNKKRRRWFAFVTMFIITVSTGGYFLWNDLFTSPIENRESSSITRKVPSVISRTGLTTSLPIINQQSNTQKIVKTNARINHGNPENPLITIFQESSVHNILPRENLLGFLQEEKASTNRINEAYNEPVTLHRQEALLTNFSVPEYKNIIKDAPVPTEPAKEETDVVKTIARERKLSWQVFFSPNISYRKLSENKSFVRPTSPPAQVFNYLGLHDVNNAVIHKPNIGFELGITSKYSISKNIKLRAGFQFNVNRYDIKAFNYVPEIATITLNNGYGVDFVNTVSNYRNFNGGKTNWLKNFYFQASVPLGAEVKITGNNKMYVGVASTIQPTYVIGDRAYLITNDYKNYAELPWLIRRWNVNTHLETFVSYSTGKTKWQIGPQVRYQLRSSFVSEYPVKENLFDFGLKVGVTLNHR